MKNVGCLRDIARPRFVKYREIFSISSRHDPRTCLPRINSNERVSADSIESRIVSSNREREGRVTNAFFAAAVRTSNICPKIQRSGVRIKEGGTTSTFRFFRDPGRNIGQIPEANTRNQQTDPFSINAPPPSNFPSSRSYSERRGKGRRRRRKRKLERQPIVSK